MSGHFVTPCKTGAPERSRDDQRSLPVAGVCHLDVAIKDTRFDAPDSAHEGYHFTQARGLAVIDTKESPNGDIGLVAVLPVGMAQVRGRVW